MTSSTTFTSLVTAFLVKSRSISLNFLELLLLLFVVGIAVARIGDSADAGAMTSGSGNVFANG